MSLLAWELCCGAQTWALEWAGLGFEPIHLYGRVTFSLSAPVPCMVREHEPNAWGLGLMVSGDHKIHADLERWGAADHMYLTKQGVGAWASVPRPDRFLLRCPLLREAFPV